MHELSIAQEMCEIIQSSLGGSCSLESVAVTIGPLSGIMPEALDFCFASVTEEMGLGTPKLTVNRTRVEIKCKSCSEIYETDDLYDLCPKCGSFDRDILSGSEFTIDSVEIEEENNV